MLRFALIATLILSFASLSASPREWKNAAGTQSFKATYLSNDGKQVTLRRGQSILTFDITKLHPDDQAWLKQNHPVGKTAAKQNTESHPKKTAETAPPTPKGAAFDALQFGDSNSEVIEKLRNSQMLECTVPEVMLARLGLNGNFRTKQAIGGLHSHLYFDWDDDLKLKEITLRTKPKDPTHYQSQLQRSWKEFIQLLTILHGDALQSAPYPKAENLQDGLILGSHLWRSENDHSVLLGTGQEGKNYSVIVRITSELIEPTPAE